MNSSSFPTDDIFEANNSGSESDTNLDGGPECYQPISTLDDDDESSEGNSDAEHHVYPIYEAENGISSIHVNGDVEQKSSSDEDEEEESRIEASDSAILRAFREDESRRNAPLTAENATRVMEAMRGISFEGSVPDWVSQVPEDQWIARLRSLRQSN